MNVSSSPAGSGFGAEAAEHDEQCVDLPEIAELRAAPGRGRPATRIAAGVTLRACTTFASASRRSSGIGAMPMFVFP